MGKVYSFSALVIFVLSILHVCEGKAFAKNTGYITDIETEYSIEPLELILVEKPDHLNGPSFNEKVFNHELSQEFLINYQQTFGRTEQEQNYFLINRQGYVLSSGVLTATQVDDARKKFAQYMSRRLIEFHGENIFKNDPNLRAIYDIKQSISNVKLDVGPSSRFDMSYSFVGNNLWARLENPYANLVTYVYMDPGSLLPTAPNEATLVAQKTLFTTNNELGFSFYSKVFRYTISRGVGIVSLNFTQTLPVVASFNAVDTSKEALSMAGLSLSF
ncbi:MAG: hypothetical protein IPM57_08800 [Oligoflexia bacterium]|nr:hypothetical protein [Oligoflexia bacterium]